MALNYQEFKQVVKSDREKLKNNVAPAGVAVCADCSIPLRETVTGNRRMGDGRHVCSDCYYKPWGDHIDNFPILTPWLV
ncbi:MAG: hypothetical protein WCK65_13680, partial [Rhodospirillaceae bacterium]